MAMAGLLVGEARETAARVADYVYTLVRSDAEAAERLAAAARKGLSIVLTGGTFFGDIKVRHRRLWEKLGRRGRLTE